MSQLDSDRKYFDKHKAEVVKKRHDYYIKNKKKLNEQASARRIQIREAWYKYNRDTVTGYLPYAQGDKNVDR